MDISSGHKGNLEVMQDPAAGCCGGGKKKDAKPSSSVMENFLFGLTGSVESCPCAVFCGTMLFLAIAVGGVASSFELSMGVPEIFPPEHNQVLSKSLESTFGTETPIKGFAIDAVSICNAHSMNESAQDTCTLHWCHSSGRTQDTASTSTTAPPTEQEAVCWRSPTFAIVGNVTRSIGFGTQKCSKVTINSRHATKKESSFNAAWQNTFQQAIVDEFYGTPSGLVGGDTRSKTLKPLVIENWDTGEVTVGNLASVSRIVASAPFQDTLSLAQECTAHVFCRQGNLPQCDLSGWRVLGKGRYPIQTRRLHDDEQGSAKRIDIPQHLHHPTRRLAENVGYMHTQKYANGIDVSIMYGVRAARWTPLVGPPPELWSYDPTFQPGSPWSQRAMREMCANMPEHLLIYKANCWIMRFEAYLTTRGKRFPSRSFDTDVVDWFNDDRIQGQQHLWFKGTQLIACKLQFYVNVRSTVASNWAIGYMQKWDDYVDRKNAKAKPTANKAWHTSYVWKRVEAQNAIIGSTRDTIIIALASGLVGVLAFTFDIKLAFIVVGVVLIVVAGLAFFITGLMGWGVGAIEVISLVVFVGYAVTYALHIAHNYNETHAKDKDLLQLEGKRRERRNDRRLKIAMRMKAKKQEGGDDEIDDVESVELSLKEEKIEVKAHDLSPRQLRVARVRVAVMHVGGATLSSAMSTAGSSAFLMFCTLSIFVKLGAVVVAVTTLSILGAIVALPACLILFGPDEDEWYKVKARMIWNGLKNGSSSKNGVEIPLEEDMPEDDARELN